MAIETNELIDVQTLPPFKKFIMSIGAIPTSYLESMSYAELLAWFCNYLQNTIIPTVNNNGEAVEELQDLFVQLKEYVDDYFDNLDFQEAVNNKLDEMATDGSLYNLIEPYVTETLNQLTNIANQAITTANSFEINELRKKYYNNYKAFDLPSPFASWFKNNIEIYQSNDKKNYQYYCDIESYKNVSSHTYYASPSGSSSGNGTEANPYDLLTAYNTASDGDTIILLEGIYWRNYNNTILIKKNINIIAKNPANTILTMASSLSWTQNETYSNVYQAPRTNVASVIDVRNCKKGVFQKLTKLSSLSDVANTKYSYYGDSTTIYVNLDEAVTNDKIVCNLATGTNIIEILSDSSNINVYLEGLTLLAGDDTSLMVENTTSYYPTLIANNCKFLYALDAIEDNVQCLGSNTIFYKCEASFADKKDGFNYHASNGRVCYGIELDCIASNNGLNASQAVNNGSTAHDGCQILRINGIYFNNYGGNIADVSNGTYTFNINCKSFDSACTENNSYSTDFCTQQTGATMYLYNCFSKGSTSKYNLYAVSGSTIHYSNCEYDTTQGGGSFINDDE